MLMLLVRRRKTSICTWCSYRKSKCCQRPIHLMWHAFENLLGLIVWLAKKEYIAASLQLDAHSFLNLLQMNLLSRRLFERFFRKSDCCLFLFMRIQFLFAYRSSILIYRTKNTCIQFCSCILKFLFNLHKCI